MMIHSPQTNHLIQQDADIRIAGHRLKTRWLTHRGSHAIDHVVVFLHEGLGCIDLWEDFPEEIARTIGLDALMYDRLGHGFSDPLPSGAIDPAYQLKEAVEYLPKMLNHFGIQRCALIGHSDGGTIALMFAARHSHQVNAIVTEGAHVLVDDTTIAGFRDAVHAYHTSDLKQKLSNYHGQKTETLFRRWSDTWLSRKFASWNIESELAAIKCPVLAIQGEQDQYGTHDQAQSIADNVGGHGESWLVPDCRHVPHYQARQRVAARIGRFLREHTDQALR